LDNSPQECEFSRETQFLGKYGLLAGCCETEFHGLLNTKIYLLGKFVMAARLQKSQLRGVIPPLVSPLNADGSVDIAGFQRLIEHVLQGGVAGVFVLGTTGEGVGISYSKRRQLVEAAAETIEGRVPLYVGITDTCLEEAIDLTDFSFHCGANSVVAAAPYYLPIDQHLTQRYFSLLADASQLPVVLYNMPSCVKAIIEPATVLALSQHENILGMKDSGGDVAYFRRIISLLAECDFPVLVGPEHLLWSTLRSGGTGGVCGGSQMWPRLYSLLVEAHEQGDRTVAATCDAYIQKVSQCVYKERAGRRVTTEAIKVILESKGICQRWVAPPLEPMCDADADNLLRAVQAVEADLSGLVEVGPALRPFAH
jgi:2-dehydro-3-deoxy-D-pentonate aldolase